MELFSFLFSGKRRNTQLENRYKDLTPVSEISENDFPKLPPAFKSFKEALKDPGNVLNLDLGSQKT